MPNQQLIDYINQKRQEGITDTQIKQELSSIGWSQSEIDEHLGVQTEIPKPKSRFDGVKLVVTAIAIVFGFFWLLVFFSDDDSPIENEINRTTENVPSINSSPQQTTTPIPVVARSWNTVIQFSGTGNKNTESFTIQEAQWRIRWSATTSSDCFGNGCPFVIRICDLQKGYCGDSIRDDISGIKNDVSNFYSTGTYYLQISGVSIKNWTAVVEIYSPTQKTTLSNTVLPKPKVEANIFDLRQYTHKVVNLLCPNVLNSDQGSFGSGIVINDKGYILTNRHVIMGVKDSIYIGHKCTVYLANEDNTFLMPTYTAFAVSILDDYDAIILRIAGNENETIINPPFNIVPFKISGSTPNIGNDILVLGFPGFDSALTLTTGKITGFETVSNQRMITISAMAEEGESGGPLLNKAGDLIGVITAKKETSNDNYAIDIRNITPWINAVIQDTSELSSKDIVTRPVDFRNSMGNQTQ
ncbi:MAG: serine protease [Candidatus Taylorbacteria bacterium]|nr:serine protease [Candidatus Taylorbacteria bacterium]